jgi:hypothetical protein
MNSLFSLSDLVTLIPGIVLIGVAIGLLAKKYFNQNLSN